MPPLSLVFSSDEGTSRSITQVLQELEFVVEPCPDIFTALEKLTSRSYDAIIVDWDEGLDATFFLKTSREMKSNRDAFPIALTSDSALNATAQQAGATLVLSKPVVPERAKYDVLTSDEFLAGMQNWLPKLDIAVSNARAEAAESAAAPRGAEPTLRGSGTPSGRSRKAHSLGHPANGPLEHIGWPYQHRGRNSRRHSAATMLFAALGAVVLSAAYILSSPVRVQASAGTFAKAYEQTLQKTQSWLRGTVDDSSDSLAQATPQAVQPVRSTPRIRVIPVYGPPEAGRQVALALPTETPPAPESLDTVSRTTIPESLRGPVPGISPRGVASVTTPSLLRILEPVNIPEDLAEKLILERVAPSYPAQALQAGLQGPVVLQAWIARDGTIRDLKLIRGPLVLGQAAYHAVKQWRYKPYYLNGQAVEAQTMVTVNFTHQ